MHTQPQISLRKGSQGVLPCVIEGVFDAVQWSKGPDPSSAVILVAYDNFDGYWKKWGKGFQDGSFDINNNFSLVINTVDISDRGRYICEVSFKEEGQLLNHSDVNVFGKLMNDELKEKIVLF